MTLTDCRYRHPGGEDGFEMTVRKGVKKKGRAYTKKYKHWTPLATLRKKPWNAEV